MRHPSSPTATSRAVSKTVVSYMLLSLILALTGSGIALAAGGDISESLAKPQNPDFVRARKLIDQGDFGGAVPLLQKVVGAEARNADAYNLLGYSLRKLERYDEALRNYQRALEIAPKHRGAHEYIGETYLALNQPEKARQHLAALDDDCWFGCEEYDELKEAIEQYEAKGNS